MTLKSLERYRKMHAAPEGYPWVRQMMDEIEREVDERYVERRECHDENNHEFNGFTCSECGEYTDYDEPFYCPWCGAKVVSVE